MKIKQALILFLIMVGCMPMQGQELILKALIKTEPTFKKLYERLNESNGEKAELTFRMVSDSSEHSLSEYKGKVVIVNMWATWCGPCLKEIPDFNKLQEKFGKDGLVVLSITDESPKKVKKFVKDREIKSINGFIRYEDELEEPFRHMRRGRPMIFIVDREGIVREGMMWVPKYRNLKKWLRG